MSDQPNTKPPLVAGGNVMAIIPRSIEEVYRVAEGVRLSKLAPYSLVGNKAVEDARASIAIVIMAGMELGLPPMASLRSFTVIGGRPALYGDGLIGVCRRSGKAKKIATGYVQGRDDATSFGWCEAERSDTGESLRKEFSVADAKRAGLWDEREKVDRRRNNASERVANDSPWYRYPHRMLAWRAAGYCLRELFADLLAGITDEFEAREIADVTYQDVTPAKPEPPPPPPDEPEQDPDAFDVDAFLEQLDTGLSTATTPDELVALWDEHEVEATLSDEGDLQRAFDIRKRHADRFAAEAGPETPDVDFPQDAFPGDMK